MWASAQEAYDLVEDKFKYIKDKAGVPYLRHLIMVSDIASQYGDGVEESYLLETIGLLHDTIEDTDLTAYDLRKQFSDKIVDTVVVLTHGKEESYSKYIERVSKHKLATIVKLADLEDNMNITRLKELTDKDITRLKKYHNAFLYLREVYLTGWS